MEKFILLLVIKVSIIMSNNLQKTNIEIEKNIISVDELSDEYIDKKKQLVLHCVNSSEYAPAVYVICKPHETQRSTTTPSFCGIHI